MVLLDTCCPQTGEYFGHGSLDLVNKLQQVYGEGCWDVQTELPAIEHLNGLVLCVHIYHVFEEGTVVKHPSTYHILPKIIFGLALHLQGVKVHP